jgi:uncharacterized surface protein with fasciclin (FAS1) repeats
MRRIILLFCLLVACKKEDHTLVVTAKPTMLQYIGNDPQLTLFKAAMQRAGLFNDSTFANGAPYTIFAPVDSAFKTAGLTADSISKYDPAALALILKYHIAFGNLGSSTLIGFYTQELITLNPVYRPTLSKNFFGIFVNGIPIIKADIVLGDGVIHKTGRIAFPPVGNLMQEITHQPDLTLFATAIRTLKLDTFLVKSPPVPINPYVPPIGIPTVTVMAPDDNAFREYGFADTTAIKNTDPVLLKQFIFYYFKLGNNFTSVLLGGAQFGAAVYDANNYGTRRFVVESDGFTITASGNVAAPHIIRPDILATNGVIQVVDQVIIP